MAGDGCQVSAGHVLLLQELLRLTDGQCRRVPLEQLVQLLVCEVPGSTTAAAAGSEGEEVKSQGEHDALAWAAHYIV
jgi:hypothetical protein